MSDQTKPDAGGVSRRQFFKTGGTVAAAVQVGAAAGAGLSAGEDPATLTGWQHLGENTQFVDRKPLELASPPVVRVGPTRRPAEVESAFGRERLMMEQMRKAQAPPAPPAQQARGQEETSPGPPPRPDEPPDREPERQSGPGPRMRPRIPALEAFSGPLGSFYKEHPEVFELDKLRAESIMPKRRADSAKYQDYFSLINAWGWAWQTSERITAPPEISDFQMDHPMMGEKRIGDPKPFKSPKLASRLIKQVAHHFGASLVGIARLNPDWCYGYGLRGSEDGGHYEVPEHWEYVIAFGVPHQWEQVNSNPNLGTSFDAYSRMTIAARRLESFIKALGYPARRHSPMDGYDLIAVPILVDTGLGQQGRHGVVITPETGSNLRVAFVTTSLPLEVDRPIDFGVNEFCKDCRICAEICPSSSISHEATNEKMCTRGYRHWEVNQTSCFNYWMQCMGVIGCRLCLIACPYSRKNNWVHALARNVDSADPTGLANDALTKMQKTFFEWPEAAEYLPPPDGRFATFRESPEWLTASNYFNMPIVAPKKGG